MGNRRFVVFTGLWPEGAGTEALPEAEAEDFIVCADGGYAVCAAAGLRPDAVIGDFDSLTSDQIAAIQSAGIESVVHSSEKDDTDTMLCVRYGLARGFSRFLIAGGIGGDFGHTMANLQTLSFLADMGCEADIAMDKERLFMTDGEAVLHGAPGAKFSVFSYTDRCFGVYIKNARYPLSDAVLTHSYPIGIHNEFINEEPATVSVRGGRLLIVSDMPCTGRL